MTGWFASLEGGEETMRTLRKQQQGGKKGMLEDKGWHLTSDWLQVDEEEGGGLK